MIANVPPISPWWTLLGVVIAFLWLNGHKS